MSDDGLMTVSGALGPMLAHFKAKEDEHAHRMKEDPTYRVEFERREAQRLAGEEEDRKFAQRQRRAALDKARQAKGIPATFNPFLDAWREGQGNDAPASAQKAHGWIQRFLRESGEWVFLFLGGPVGVGKSCAAAWFLDAPRITSEPDPFGGPTRTTTRDVAGRFITAEALTKASTFAADFWDGLRDAPRLVIDDLGVERLDDKGWALANLTALLSHRHAHRLPTVITLNLNRRTFEERYAAHDGGRLRDRLAESAWFVELTGPSLRRRLSLEPTSATAEGGRNP
jgi:DNA replication protein DnaC